MPAHPGAVFDGSCSDAMCVFVELGRFGVSSQVLVSTLWARYADVFTNLPVESGSYAPAAKSGILLSRVVFLSVFFACCALCCPLPPDLRNVVRSYPGFPKGRGQRRCPIQPRTPA